MNSRAAKKIRKYSRRNWIEYFNAIRQWPFLTRLHFCWDILFGYRWKTKKPKKISRDNVLRQRRSVPSQ